MTRVGPNWGEHPGRFSTYFLKEHCSEDPRVAEWLHRSDPETQAKTIQEVMDRVAGIEKRLARAEGQPTELSSRMHKLEEDLYDLKAVAKDRNRSMLDGIDMGENE